MCIAGLQGTPDDSRAGKGVVNNAGQAALLTEGSHSRDIRYLQQRIADCFYVEHLPHSDRLGDHLVRMVKRENTEK